MKTLKKIITLLFVVGLTGANAQSGSGGYKPYLKGSVGMADYNDSSLEGFGFSGGFNESIVYSFEGGFYASDQFSFGFEYTAFDLDGDLVTENMSTDLADNLNSIFEIAPTAPNFNEGYTGKFQDDYDLDRFMFVMNYEYFLKEDITISLSGGLGIIHAKQSVKASRDADGDGTVHSLQTLVNSEADDTVFAYQLGVNFGYHFNDGYTLYTGVRYLASSSIDFNHGAFILNDEDVDIVSYDIGLRYAF